MPAESGCSLVTGALQFHLARAQKTYQFHGENSAYNSEDKKLKRKQEKQQNKKLESYCESIRSKFASYTTQQLLELGNALQFKSGGKLKQFISEEVKDKIILLEQKDTPKNKKLGRRVIFCDPSIILSPQETSSVAVESPKKSKNEIDVSPPKKCLVLAPRKVAALELEPELDNSKKTTSRFDNPIEKVLKQLKDKTIAKNKRKRLIKKLKRLQKLKSQNQTEPEPEVQSEPEPQVAPNKVIDEYLKSEQKFKQSESNKRSAAASASTPTFAINGSWKLSDLCKTFGNHNHTEPKTLNLSSSKKLPKLLKLTKMGPESENSVAMSNGNSSSTTTPTSPGTLQLPEPKRILYPKEKIQLGWKYKRGPGAGFHNFGNTCYLNSSLQALFHIPAFVNWLQNDDEHRRVCNGVLPNQTTCIICVVYVTFQEHLKSGCAIRPRVLDKLKAICKHFSYGRQEDAHEFLRYLLEGMERSYLTLINGLRLDNRTKETNPLGQIFGGYIRTEVTCLQCGFVSTTFQPSSELQLDIRHTTTLEDALQQHFRKERLDNNDYKCEKCKTISQATKQFSLELPPLVLCLQLKRFTLYGNKISKRIHCNKFLNMSRYLHKSKRNGFSQNQELKYRLVALVTHMGQSPNCGHYTAIAEGCNNNYYHFDDQYVFGVSVQTALNNDAYVIIYEMEKSSQPFVNGMSTAVSATSGSGYSIISSPSPSKAKPCTVTSGVLNGINGNGSPSAQKKPFVIPFAKKNQNSTNGTGSALRAAVMSNTDAVAKTNGHSNSNDRKVITFGLNANSNSFMKTPATATTTTSSPNKIHILKPGVALTNSSKVYGNGNSSATESNQLVPKANCVKLVPYNDIENDSDKSDKDEQVATQTKSKKENESTPTKNPNPLSMPTLTNQNQKIPLSIEKKLIGPVLQEKQISTPTPPTKSKNSSSITQPSPDNPEKTFGVKRKLQELLGPKPPPPKKNIQGSPVLNATSEWTITTNTSNGYASDPDTSSKSKSQKKALNRAKSMERDTASFKIQPKFPRFNSADNKSLTNGLSPVKSQINDTTTTPLKEGKNLLTNGIAPSTSSLPVVVNGHHDHTPKKKRKRSSSSSSSSRSSSPGEKERKRKKKKDRRKSKKRSSSSGSDEGDNDLVSSGKKSKKLKKKKKKHHHHSKDKESKESLSSSSQKESKETSGSQQSQDDHDGEGKKLTNGWSGNGPSREMLSEERDRILRQARNPSRSPPRSSMPTESPKKKFQPEHISRREKSILGWNGEESVLSKSIEEDRKRRLGDKDLFDEEMDEGRTKKQRKSRSPGEDGPRQNRFQAVQDNKKAVETWSKMLDGYGPGFKDHKNVSPMGGRKPWKFVNAKDSKRNGSSSSGRDDSNSRHQNETPKSNGDRHLSSNSNPNYSTSSSYSSSSSSSKQNYRTHDDHHHHKTYSKNYRNSNSNGNRNHYSKSKSDDKSWKHYGNKNSRNHR